MCNSAVKLKVPELPRLFAPGMTRTVVSAHRVHTDRIHNAVIV